MKKELSSTTIGVVIGVVVLAIGVAAYVMFGSELGGGPPIKPQPFKPPAGYQWRPPGGPIGAPAQPPAAPAKK